MSRYAFLLFLCIAPAALGQDAETRNKALLAIERLQGEVRVLPTMSGKPAFGVSFAGNLDVSDEDLAFLATLPGLEVLSLNGTQIGDRTLQSLKSAAELRELYLNNTRVTDE